MKRTLLSLVGLSLLSVVAHGQVLRGNTLNFAYYGKGLVCRVPSTYGEKFGEVIRTTDSQTSRTDAVKLLGFFKATGQGDCFGMDDDGTFALSLPGRGTAYFVFFLVMTDDGSDVYWQTKLSVIDENGNDPLPAMVFAPPLSLN